MDDRVGALARKAAGLRLELRKLACVRRIVLDRGPEREVWALA
jgi:hypothetical protein